MMGRENAIKAERISCNEGGGKFRCIKGGRLDMVKVQMSWIDDGEMW